MDTFCNYTFQLQFRIVLNNKIGYGICYSLYKFFNFLCKALMAIAATLTTHQSAQWWHLGTAGWWRCKTLALYQRARCQKAKCCWSNGSRSGQAGVADCCLLSEDKHVFSFGWLFLQAQEKRSWWRAPGGWDPWDFQERTQSTRTAAGSPDGGNLRWCLC